jgi:hypothetical protein
MNLCDGVRFSPNSNAQTVKCTRWQELVDAVRNHAQLAAMTKAPTIFRLLNTSPDIPSEFTIAHQPIFDENDMQRQVSELMNSISSIQPTGMTPLTYHLYDIRSTLLSMDHSLRARNQYVSLVIATDGLPSDEKGTNGLEETQLFIHALQQLERLSIRIVIRLCSREETVKQVRILQHLYIQTYKQRFLTPRMFQFYFKLRPLLRSPLQIIEDYRSEANIINKWNPWLNYILPIHRFREMGVPDSVLITIKERSLTSEEMKEYCMLLFGSELTSRGIELRHDFSQFLKVIKCIAKKDHKQNVGKVGNLILTDALGHYQPCCSIL